jgi:hypothetical protein
MSETCTCEGIREISTRPVQSSSFFRPLHVRVCVTCDRPVLSMGKPAVFQPRPGFTWKVWQKKVKPDPVTCIMCGKVQTHRVCGECFRDDKKVGQ